MNDKPLVSILVACYNQEVFIVDCIKGMLDQTYSNVELIISDDASTDNTWESICKYKEMLESQLSKVVLIHQEKNLGFIKNLNSMLEKATGDYVKIIAGDDFLDKDYVFDLVEHARKQKDIGVWFTNGYVVDEASSYENKLVEGLFYTDGPRFDNHSLVQQIYGDNFIFAPSAFVKKELYDLYGIYDETLAIEDWEMWLRLATNGVEFGYLNKALVYYRKNSQSITSLTNTEKLEAKRIQIYQSSKKIVERYCNYVDIKNWMERLVQLFIIEKKIAKKKHLVELEKLIDKDIDEFIRDKRVKIKYKIKYFRRIRKETLEQWER